MNTQNGYDRVLSLWFGDLDEAGCAAPDKVQRWFKKDAAFDQMLRDEFGADHRAILAGERESWLETPRGRLATVIVLDQFSRNMFRNTPDMFASDAVSLRIALESVDKGWDRELPTDMRVFMYMPTMHSEDLEVQERGVKLFAAFCDELDGDLHQKIEKNLSYAKAHRDIIKKWGRFPHRNKVLGRDSTSAEEEFLKTPGSSF